LKTRLVAPLGRLGVCQNRRPGVGPVVSFLRSFPSLRSSVFPREPAAVDAVGTAAAKCQSVALLDLSAAAKIIWIPSSFGARPTWVRRCRLTLAGYQLCIASRLLTQLD